jgi:hypothetical protein
MTLLISIQNGRLCQFVFFFNSKSTIFLEIFDAKHICKNIKIQIMLTARMYIWQVLKILEPFVFLTQL